MIRQLRSLGYRSKYRIFNPANTSAVIFDPVIGFRTHAQLGIHHVRQCHGFQQFIQVSDEGAGVPQLETCPKNQRRRNQPD